jgi:hypothetical protein
MQWRCNRSGTKRWRHEDAEITSEKDKQRAMILRLKAESRACLLDSTRPGSLVHDVLSGAPVIRRAGDPPGGLYEIDCTDSDCQELKAVAATHCPDALGEIEAEISRLARG